MRQSNMHLCQTTAEAEAETSAKAFKTRLPQQALLQELQEECGMLLVSAFERAAVKEDRGANGSLCAATKSSSAMVGPRRLRILSPIGFALLCMRFSIGPALQSLPLSALSAVATSSASTLQLVLLHAPVCVARADTLTDVQ